MATIQGEIAAIAAAQGYEGDAPKTIAEAVDAVTVALGGEAHGGTIAQAIANLAPSIGGGGGGSDLPNESVTFLPGTASGSVSMDTWRVYDNPITLDSDYDSAETLSIAPLLKVDSSPSPGPQLRAGLYMVIGLDSSYSGLQEEAASLSASFIPSLMSGSTYLRLYRGVEGVQYYVGENKHWMGFTIPTPSEIPSPDGAGASFAKFGITFLS